VDPAAAHAFDDFGIGNIDFKHVVDAHTGFLHRFCLRNGAREAIEQVAGRAVGLSQSVPNQADDDVIGDQTARVHHLLRRESEGRAGFDRCAQHIARGNLRDAEPAGDERSLRAFAGTRGAKEDQTHENFPKKG
jgi:hypothetical protein